MEVEERPAVEESTVFVTLPLELACMFFCRLGWQRLGLL
jgi:hypothetical protein